jgi:hypothetical protein
VLLLFVVLAEAAGANPAVTIAPDGTRTITWTVDDPTLSLENVTVEGPSGALDWRAQSFDWSDGQAFARNGTLPAEFEATPNGLELREDVRNYVPQGDLDSPGTWDFTGDPDGNVSSSWGLPGVAVVSHLSPSSPRLRWESFDTETNWTGLPSDAEGDSDLASLHTNPKEGDGMLLDIITTGLSPGSWAGAQRVGVFNWSAYDRILVWVYSPLIDGVAFGVTVQIGAGTPSTASIPLVGGWQEIVLDLAPLGPGREVITLVQLRFYGVSLSAVHFWIDDFRLSTARTVDGTGSAAQVIEKANSTSPVSGSGLLSFRWRAINLTNISSTYVGFNISGTFGGHESYLWVVSVAAWSTFSEDVSRWTSTPGDYGVRVWARFTTDTTGAANGTIEFDDVIVRFPARQNGTYVSDRIGFGDRAQGVALSWNASSPESGSARVALRAGDSDVPDDGSWTVWTEWSSPGAYATAVRGRYFQVRAFLGTTNASESPRLESVSLLVRHRAPIGSFTTALFEPEDDFARWIDLELSGTTESLGSLLGEFWNGTEWVPVESETGLSLAPPSIRLRVSLVSADQVESPSLSSFTLRYDVVRAQPQIWDWATGNPWAIAALLVAAGGYGAYAIGMRYLSAIEDVFLVARDGRLIIHNTRRLRAEWDEDTFAGMLTAISAFVRDSFKEERGELNRFEFSGKTVLIERVDSIYVAALYSGHVTGRVARNLKAFAADLEDRYGDRLRSWSGSPEDLQDLKELTARFVGPGRYRRLGGPGRAE